MVALNPPVCGFGQAAIDFKLPDADGKYHTLASCRGPNGLLVMFICNHCPYVKAIIDRLIRDCRELTNLGIGSVAIMSNDATVNPEDSVLQDSRAILQVPGRRLQKNIHRVCSAGCPVHIQLPLDRNQNK